MNPRMNERNRLKRKMANAKRRLASLADRIGKNKVYDVANGNLVTGIVYELEDIQRQINALSADVDEKVLLEQSLKRVQKAKKAK